MIRGLFQHAFLYGRALPILLPASSDCSPLAVTQAFTGNLGRSRDGNWVGDEDSLFDQDFLTGI